MDKKELLQKINSLEINDKVDSVEKAKLIAEIGGDTRLISTWNRAIQKVKEIISEYHKEEPCVECGAWPDEGHGIGCVAVE